MAKQQKQNFVKLDRGIGESQIWEKPSDWLKIWIWLLKEARYSNPTDTIPLGCVLTNYKYIEGFCRVSYKSIENCLRWMKVEGMVVVQKRNRLVLIELKNWSKFHTGSSTGGGQIGNGQEIGSSTIIEEGKKKRKKEYISIDGFSKIQIQEELEKYLSNWNDLFNKRYIKTKDLESIYLKLREEYTKENIRTASGNYYDKNSLRTTTEKKQFELHILKFLGQKSNGIINYM